MNGGREEEPMNGTWAATPPEDPAKGDPIRAAALEAQDFGNTFLPPAQLGEPRSKGGRPKGFSGTRSKMPSALAIAFKKAGLDWREDFAIAIKSNKRERIKLWLKLLPYMITTSAKSRVKKWKGKPSKAAMIALETLEGKE